MTIPIPLPVPPTIQWQDLSASDQKLALQFEELTWRRIKSDASNVDVRIARGNIDFTQGLYINYRGLTIEIGELLHNFLWMHDVDNVDQLRDYISRTKGYFLPKIDVANFSRQQIVFMSDADKDET